jgi:dihydroneopterin triphosphate diphosphatase
LTYKIPRSVLVVIYCTDASDGVARALLIERADHPGFWQSVTGSLDSEDEPLLNTCQREVMEETGIHAPTSSFDDLQISNVYGIYPHWRKRYAPGVLENTEHVFSLRVPYSTAVRLAPLEHLSHQWLPLASAAMACFSWTNAKAIEMLQARLSS